MYIRMEYSVFLSERVSKCAVLSICLSPWRLTLFGLDDRGRDNCRAEDNIPELACDAESVLVVEEMVLEVVLLQLPVVERQILVVQEVVRHVVARVAEDTTTKDGSGHTPVPVEHRVREIPERSSEYKEEGWWHDQAVLVHGQVVVNAVEQEVGCYANSVVWQVARDKVSVKRRTARGQGSNLLVQVKQESMEDVFNNGPKEQPKNKVRCLARKFLEALGSLIDAI